MMILYKIISAPVSGRTRKVETIIFTSRKVKKATDGLFVTSSSNRRGSVAISAEK